MAEYNEKRVKRRIRINNALALLGLFVVAVLLAVLGRSFGLW